MRYKLWAHYRTGNSQEFNRDGKGYKTRLVPFIKGCLKQDATLYKACTSFEIEEFSPKDYRRKKYEKLKEEFEEEYNEN